MTASRFAGKWVAVTGAGTGFGAAIAVRAAAEGADVVVHYNSSADGARKTADRITAHGRRTVLVQADLARSADVDHMIEHIWTETGGIDVLVNNTSVINAAHQSWSRLDEEAIDRMLAVTVKGTMLMTHGCGVRMLERGHGAIVNIGSASVVRGVARAPEYAATKYALLGLTKSYARAFAPTIRVNAFAPGFMETESTLGRDNWETTLRPEVLSETPLQRIPGPDDLAAAALWLASEEAAHMTGGLIISDGGRSMVGA